MKDYSAAEISLRQQVMELLERGNIITHWHGTSIAVVSELTDPNKLLLEIPIKELRKIKGLVKERGSNKGSGYTFYSLLKVNSL